MAQRHGAYDPKQGDAKRMLATGKVRMADMVGGDGAPLKAMGTNESDPVTAYRRGAENAAVPDEDRDVFRCALEDEQRQKSWLDETATAT